MNKLDVAKKVIKEYIKEAECGIYDTRNIAGDSMTTIFNEDGLQIDICYHWEYFEVFGLDGEEFQELEKYYHELRGW